MGIADEILNLDVVGLGAKLRSRELSPVEVTDVYLDRIAATEKKLCAYIAVTAELARSTALAAEREIAAGNWRGTFHGVPIALKDLCCTRGILTTSGSKVLADHVPDHDATVWTRLAAAGAILLGKLNMHEFACGGTAKTAWGTTLNPYDPERHVWLVDDGAHSIYKFTNDGKKLVMTLGEFKVPGDDERHFGRPTEIAWLPDGTFFVKIGRASCRGRV